MDYGKTKNNDYTTEQLLDENLKNIDGESNKEVKERMLKALEEIISKYIGKVIVVVSHAAAIKFLLTNWLKYDYESNSFLYNGSAIFSANLESPSCLKLEFDGNNLISIEKI